MSVLSLTHYSLTFNFIAIMRIIETFICLIPITNTYVKVHRGRDNKSQLKYFIELKDGTLEEISDIYFESIRI